MDEPAVKRRIGQIVGDMRDVLDAGVLDEKAHGRLCGSANELSRLESELSGSRLRVAIRSAVQLILGGVVGYAVGAVADHLEGIVNLL